jgi:hypothetical protein
MPEKAAPSYAPIHREQRQFSDSLTNARLEPRMRKLLYLQNPDILEINGKTKKTDRMARATRRTQTRSAAQESTSTQTNRNGTTS